MRTSRNPSSWQISRQVGIGLSHTLPDRPPLWLRCQVCTLTNPDSAPPPTMSRSSHGRPGPAMVAVASQAVMPPAVAGATRAAYQVRARHSRQDSQVTRSEEHTSELQSRPHLVCRLLLE